MLWIGGRIGGCASRARGEMRRLELVWRHVLLRVIVPSLGWFGTGCRFGCTSLTKPCVVHTLLLALTAMLPSIIPTTAGESVFLKHCETSELSAQ